MNQSEIIFPESEPKEAPQVKVQPPGKGLPEKRQKLDGLNAGGRRNLPRAVSTKTSTGISWSAMISRCYYLKNRDYSLYGGAGVRVCSGLQRGPEAIVELIGVRPQEKSIDRINGKGSYTCGACQDCKGFGHPLNIRWASTLVQRHNQDRDYLTINGITKRLPEWAITAGISQSALFRRIKKGWSGAMLLMGPMAPTDRAKVSMGQSVEQVFLRNRTEEIKPK